MNLFYFSWENGENHIIFNMIAGSPPEFNTVIDLNTGRALIAGAGFDSWTYRTSFDISLPLYSPDAISNDDNDPTDKMYLIMSSQMNLYEDHMRELRDLADAHDDFLLLNSCNENIHETNYSTRCQYKTGVLYNYPEILKHAHFCLVGRGVRLAQSTLLEGMAAGCIPVVVADSIVMPFQSVLDWHRTAVFVPEENLLNLISILKGISRERMLEMAHQSKWLFDNYFSSIKKITTVTLDIINDRVFPLMAKSYEQWNMPPNPVNLIVLYLYIYAFINIICRLQLQIRYSYQSRHRKHLVLQLSY